MKAYQNFQGDYRDQLGDGSVLDSILSEDYISAKKTLKSLEHRIAERKKLEYKNFLEIERQRQKIEETMNSLNCFFYDVNPKMVMVRSKLATEMMRLELRVGEEAVSAFRDVERLEAEKRKILDDLRSEESMACLSRGYA